MPWRKLGLVFCPSGAAPWIRTHASTPVADPLGNGHVRVFFSCRDDRNRSSIGWVVLDAAAGFDVVEVAREPTLSPGATGAYDDSGTSMGSLVRLGGRTYLFYVGWNLAVTVPWRNSIGLAISDHAPTEAPRFEKVSTVPILDRNPADPFSMSYPCVLCDGTVWHMWYGTDLQTGSTRAQAIHAIRYARSLDGYRWDPQPTVAVAPCPPEELAVCRPSVVKDPTGFRMWFAHRGSEYRLGYAESADGVNWSRRDAAAGLDVSASGWDAEAVTYPSVFDLQGQRYLLYNGNGYGRSGFGVAVWVDCE